VPVCFAAAGCAALHYFRRQAANDAYAANARIAGATPAAGFGFRRQAADDAYAANARIAGATPAAGFSPQAGVHL
jgi:hypothetical protein